MPTTLLTTMEKPQKNLSFQSPSKSGVLVGFNLILEWIGNAFKMEKIMRLGTNQKEETKWANILATCQAKKQHKTIGASRKFLSFIIINLFCCALWTLTWLFTTMTDHKDGRRENFGNKFQSCTALLDFFLAKIQWPFSLIQLNRFD